jgi:hypothetical protein
MYEEKLEKTECHGSRYSKLGNVTDRDLAVTKGGRDHDLPPDSERRPLGPLSVFYTFGVRPPSAENE